MNLSENLREPIRNRDMATKVDMLCSFKRRQLASQVKSMLLYKQANINVYISEESTYRVECNWNTSRC